MKHLQYVVEEAISNIRVNRTTTVIAVATTAFTLSCFGVFLLLYLNLKELTSALQQDIEVILYLADGLSSQQVGELQQRLAGQPEIGSLKFVSKDQALADFRSQFPSEQRLLQGLGENPLPASFVITLTPQYRSSVAVKRWTERLKALPGIAEVQYSRDWIDTLATIVRYIELGAMAVGMILAAASVTIIASTIRLALYARRDEIEILRLVGATGTFIKVPYLLEGAVLGLFGGALSLLVLRGGFEFYRMQLGPAGRFLGVESAFGFFPAQVSLVLVTVGLALGCLGSFISLAEFGRNRL
jgi:cell division transport system permease protein